MDKMTLYHGSERIIKTPIYGFKNNDSDYGDAFYCVQDIEAAKEWANKDNYDGYVNQFSLDVRGLKILDLTSNEYSVFNWLAILIEHRKLDSYFVQIHQREIKYLKENYLVDAKEYDLVIGYRADDAYFKFPLAFLNSEIRMESLESIYKLGNLGKQVAVISEKAFSKLKYIKSVKVEPYYKEKYKTRLQSAKKQYEELLIFERYKKGTRLIDLVKD